MIPGQVVSNASQFTESVPTEHVKTPEQARHHIVIRIFQRKAQSHQPCQHERRADEDSSKTDFWFEVASMALDVLVGDEVV